MKNLLKKKKKKNGKKLEIKKRNRKVAMKWDGKENENIWGWGKDSLERKETDGRRGEMKGKVGKLEKWKSG